MKVGTIKKNCLAIIVFQTIICSNIYAQSKQNTEKVLPDIGKLLDSVAVHVGNGDLPRALEILTTGNADLRSSELYCYGSFFACKGNFPDMAVDFLNKAIDAGMNNPNILGKDPVLDTVRNSKDWPQVRDRLARIKIDLQKPKNFDVDFSTMAEFWNAYDKATADSLEAKTIFENYILDGSDAIRDFYTISYKNVDAIVSETLYGSKNTYVSVKDAITANSLKTIEKEATKMMLRLHDIYPTTVFPKVYIVSGIGNSGGTLTNLGLFIGAEKFVDKKGNLKPGMKNTILHELIHFQQNYGDFEINDTVLGKSIQEGVCDFIVTLCSGNYTEGKVMSDFEKNYDKDYVLGEFKTDMFTKDLSKWIYNSDDEENPKMPTDMAYKLGKVICASYYDNSTDKEKAVFELLNTDNFKAILSKSDFGYLIE